MWDESPVLYLSVREVECIFPREKMISYHWVKTHVQHEFFVSKWWKINDLPFASIYWQKPSCVVNYFLLLVNGKLLTKVIFEANGKFLIFTDKKYVFKGKS